MDQPCRQDSSKSKFHHWFFFKEISFHVIPELRKTTTSLWLDQFWNMPAQLGAHTLRRILTNSKWYNIVRPASLQATILIKQVSLPAMLAKLNLPSLALRRHNTKLVTFHKIINQQIQIPNNDLNLVHPAT